MSDNVDWQAILDNVPEGAEDWTHCDLDSKYYLEFDYYDSGAHYGYRFGPEPLQRTEVVMYSNPTTRQEIEKNALFQKMKKSLDDTGVSSYSVADGEQKEIDEEVDFSLSSMTSNFERTLLGVDAGKANQTIGEASQAWDSAASKSDGSTASYYELPEGATELQHLISHRDMNAQIGEAFRACYRYGLVEHSEMLRDAKKIKFYAEAEIERLEKLAERVK